MKTDIHFKNIDEEVEMKIHESTRLPVYKPSRQSFRSYLEFKKSFPKGNYGDWKQWEKSR